MDSLNMNVFFKKKGLQMLTYVSVESCAIK